MSETVSFLVFIIVFLAYTVLRLLWQRHEHYAEISNLQRQLANRRKRVDDAYETTLRTALRLGRFHNHGLDVRQMSKGKPGQQVRVFCVQLPDVIMLYEYEERFEHVFEGVPQFEQSNALKTRRTLKVVK